jgi:hypothetical protein
MPRFTIGEILYLILKEDRFGHYVSTFRRVIPLVV